MINVLHVIIFFYLLKKFFYLCGLFLIQRFGDLWNTFKSRGKYFNISILQFFLYGTKTLKWGINKNTIIVHKNFFGTKINHFQFQFFGVYTFCRNPKVTGMVKHELHRPRSS